MHQFIGPSGSFFLFSDSSDYHSGPRRNPKLTQRSSGYGPNMVAVPTRSWESDKKHLESCRLFFWERKKTTHLLKLDHDFQPKKSGQIGNSKVGRIFFFSGQWVSRQLLFGQIFSLGNLLCWGTWVVVFKHF